MMLRKIRRDDLIRNQKGAAVIEMAFALPALIVLMWMIIQLGLVFRAMSGIQHGLGQGARLATVHSQQALPARKNQIELEIKKAVYGIGPGNFEVVKPENGTLDGANYLDLRVNYEQATDMLLFPGPTIKVSRTKRVWISL